MKRTPTLTLGRPPRSRMRGLLRKTRTWVAVATLVVLLTYTAFRRGTRLVPPSDVDAPLARTVQVEMADTGSRLVLGRSWLEQRGGISHLHLRGNPREIGHAHGLLAGRPLSNIEREIAEFVFRTDQGAFSGWWYRNQLRWRLRALPRALSPRHLVEVGAFSATNPGAADLPETAFYRVISGHAIYELAQKGREHQHMSGCAAIAAWGPQVTHQGVIAGRIFSLRVGRSLTRLPTVFVVAGDRGLPFVAVGWPGLLGAVTGVNRARLFVALNPAQTVTPLQPSGTPAVFVARQILERARTIAQAVAIVRESRVLASFSLLLADGKVPTAAVVEVSPTRVAVRQGDRDSVASTNHFVHAQHHGDASNDRTRRYTSSGARYQRLLQLLRRFRGRIDAETMALILRNRTGSGDTPLALGHGGAIDSLSATHGVVVDLQSLVLWVGRGPYLLGSFAAVDLKPLFGMTVDASEIPTDLAADPLYDSAEVARLQLARAQMRHARLLQRAGANAAAEDYARRAVQGAPRLPQARILLANLLWARGATAEARRHYREFLALGPPLKQQIEVAQDRLTE